MLRWLPLGVFGVPWACFGTSLDSLWLTLGCPWAPLRRPGALVGTPWLPLSPFGLRLLGTLGLPLSPFRMPLAPFVSLWGAFGSLWPSFGVASACLGIPLSNYWIFYEMSFSFASKCCSDPPSTRAGGQDYGSTQTPSKHSEGVP